MRHWGSASLACALLFGAAGAQAGTQTGGVAVTINRPVTMTKLRDLDFGALIAGAAAGVVTVDPNTSARTVTGGTIVVGDAGQTAQFRIVASPNTVVQITRNALPVLTRAGGGATMNVVLLTINGTTTAVPSGSGTFDIAIGGRLSVGANQLPGDYSGTFEINANYQ